LWSTSRALPRAGWTEAIGQLDAGSNREGIRTMENNSGRRIFLKGLFTTGTLWLTTWFFFRKNQGFELAKMLHTFGPASAEAACGSSYSCSGGGGQCGSAYSCAGGGGQCGSAYSCAGGGRSDGGGVRKHRRRHRSGGGGQCGSAYECAGGGGQCGSAYDCAGGGGQCGSASDCAGK
jgi:hypothetical protein